MDLYETKKKHSIFNKRNLIILIIVAVLAGLGFAGYKIFKSHKSHHTNNSQTSTTSNVEPVVTLPTQQYNSDDLGIGFNYPNSWVANEVPNSNEITLTSTVLHLKTSSNQSVDGKVILTILDNPQSSLPAFKGGDASAVIESQLLNYKNPTSTQKASTYVSFLHYSGSTGSSGSIDGVYITGNLGYQVGQNAHQSDILQVSPIIYYSFVSCSNSSCSTTSPMSIPKSLWQNNNFSGPLLSILESLTLT